MPGTLKTLSNCNLFAISLQGLHCVNNFIRHPSITSLWRKLILKTGPPNLKPSDQQFLFLNIHLSFWTFSPHCSPPQEVKPLLTLLSNLKLSSSPCLLNTISSQRHFWIKLLTSDSKSCYLSSLLCRQSDLLKCRFYHAPSVLDINQQILMS